MTFDFQSLRNGLARMQPVQHSDAVTPPELQQIYTPEGHESALDPERVLVIGGRGTGKSFWSGCLLNAETREFVGQSYPRLSLKSCKVSLGFGGVDTDENGAPSRDELDDLIVTDGHDPEKVWRAVILNGIARHISIDVPRTLRGSSGLVAWVAHDAARVQRVLREADDALNREGKRVLLVFDALDRLGRNWEQIRSRTRALLQVSMAMRTYRAIKPKIFLRTDQAEDRGVANFPDASKLLSAGARVDLTWEARDLFGLLYTFLANDESSSSAFRDLVADAADIAISRKSPVTLPKLLKETSQLQETVFIALAGKYMGASATKGRTYTWIHNHLSDAFGRVSPRTFLAAIQRAAAVHSSNTEGLVLPPSGLRAGIQAASALRVQQLKEEYEWIENVILPLADQQVPCPASALFDRWTEAGTVSQISHQAGQALEPIEFSEDQKPESILTALQRIGIAERRADGRINIPDIYRVAARMLRKGGVTPGRV